MSPINASTVAASRRGIPSVDPDGVVIACWHKSFRAVIEPIVFYAQDGTLTGETEDIGDIEGYVIGGVEKPRFVVDVYFMNVLTGEQRVEWGVIQGKRPRKRQAVQIGQCVGTSGIVQLAVVCTERATDIDRVGRGKCNWGCG